MKQRENGGGRVFFRKRDLLIVGAVLAVAAGLWLLLRGGAQGGVAVARIGTGNAQISIEIPLNRNESISIDAVLPVQLEVKDGAVRFVNSVCPDHDCEGFGFLRHEGDWAACLPAQVVVEIAKQGT